ncbi:MAG: hypothetical protein JWQ04_2956 [Pedosphaera sp.]|nr:hypothetical protein [Pedosphaera sp.]
MTGGGIWLANFYDEEAGIGALKFLYPGHCMLRVFC